MCSKTSPVKSPIWFRIPRSDIAFRHCFFILLFGLFFLCAYGGASIVSGFVPYRVSIDIPFEANIPYLPHAPLLYVSLNIMLAMAPFLLRTWQQMWMLFSLLVIETFIAVFFFILMPVEATPTVAQGHGFLSGIYALAETMNMERNEFPSLHVAYAVTAALVYRHVHGSVAAWVFGVWSIVIVGSTVFMKEHYVLDVVGGAGLAVLVWSYCRRPLSTPEWLSIVDVELIAIREMLTFSIRHRRYATIMISIYLFSLFGWRKRRILRTGFACLQWIDDLLDHDRPATHSPLLTAGNAIEQLNGAAADNTRLSRLVASMREDLNSEGRAIAIKLIQVMCDDNRRMIQHAQMQADQLQAHLDQTFILSIDLFMNATESPLRAVEFPELIQALSWCSVERDLPEDLAHGLINIPAEIIGGASFDKPIELLDMPHVQQWRLAQRAEIVPVLDGLDATLVADRRSGAGLLRMFARSIRKYT